MPVHLPILGSGVELLSVCAWIDQKNKKAAAQFKKNGELFLEAKYAAGSMFAQVAIDLFDDGDIHCHAIIAAKKYFKGRAVPKKLVDIARVTEALESYVGAKVDRVIVSGQFRVPTKSVPKYAAVASLSRVSLKVGGSELTINGVELSIKDSPYSELSWRLDDSCIAGRLQYTSRPGVLSDDYLAISAAAIEQGVDRYILEKESSDEPRSF